MPSVVTTVGT